MNRTPDVELVLREYFADDGLTAPDYVLDVVEERIGRQPRRRAWRLPWRPNAMNRTLLYLAAAAAVLVVAVVGYNLLPRQGGVGGQATPPATAAPTTVTTTAPASSPIAIFDGDLPAGRYQMEAHGISIVADVPAGWKGNPMPFLTSGEGFDQEQVLITFMLVDGLFKDACHWDVNGTGASSQPGDVKVGPTVSDLVDALRANTSYTSSTPSAVTFGTFKGTQLELQLPGADVLATCDIEKGDQSGSYYVFSGPGIYAQGPDNRWKLSVVDVAGTRLVVLLSYFSGTPQAELEAARAIVGSFQLTP